MGCLNGMWGFQSLDVSEGQEQEQEQQEQEPPPKFSKRMVLSVRNQTTSVMAKLEVNFIN